MHQIRDPPPTGPDTKPSLFRRLQNVRRQTTRLVHIPVAARVSAVQRKYIKNKSKTIIINRAKTKYPCLRLLCPPAFTSELGLKWRAELFPFGYVKLKILN